MQKVKLIHHQYLSAPNGANTVMNSLLESNEQFAQYGIVITSLSPDTFAPRSFSSTKQMSAKNIWRARMKKWLKVATRYSTIAADLMIYLSDIRPAKKIIKKYLATDPVDEEVVFFHALAPCYYYIKHRKHNQHVVVVFHTNGDNFKMDRIYYPTLDHSFIYKRMKIMEDYVLQKADRINFVSEMSAKCFLKLHPQVESRKVSFVYNGVPDVIRAKRNRHQSDIVEFCCVASISKRKGQCYIVDALSRFNSTDIPYVHFTFVGDGPDRTELEKRVNELGLNDYFAFVGLSQNVDEYLMNSDIYILPSEDEGLPMAIIEAMRASLPIVSTSVGGVPEMVINKTNGILINPCAEDVYDLLCHIKDYDWKQMGVNARKIFEEKFSLKKMVDGYSKILTFER